MQRWHLEMQIYHQQIIARKDFQLLLVVKAGEIQSPHRTLSHI